MVRIGLESSDGAALSHPTYARVHMTLSELLEPEFLDTYFKQGDIMMLSEGRGGQLVDEYRFEVYGGGKLRIEMDRAVYERCGLQGGRAVEDGGKKHQKQRWVVEYDLRAPSMEHGKKGFARLEWAARNVLVRSVAWLFYNFNGSSAEALREGREVVSRHAPWICQVERSVTQMKDVLVPRVSTGDLPRLYAEEDAFSLLEYLHMLNLNSPRVYKGDDIDPHLSRYEVPDFGTGLASRHLVRVSWKGFISPDFVRDLFLLVRQCGFKGNGRGNSSHEDEDVDVDMVGGSGTQDATEKEEIWFAMSAQAFGGKSGWSVMQFAGRETLVWEAEN